MARYNEILVGRYARAVQKLFGVKGEVPVASLAGEIVVSHVVFNGAENRYLEGWDRFGAFGNQPALAANPSRYVLRNPAGSNVLAVVEKLLVVESVADPQPGASLANGITADAGTVLGSPRRIDSRGRPNATLVQSRDNAAAGGTAFFEFALQANISFELIVFEEQELVLLPGDGLQVASGVNNVGLTVACIFRERFLEEGERT